MPVPYPHSRLFWDGTDAEVTALSGWSRDTLFDAKFLQGDDETFTGDAAGGSGGHVHVMAAHTHGGSSHTHSSSGGARSGGTDATVKFEGSPTGVQAPTQTHSHLPRTSPAATLDYTASAGSSKTLISVAAPPPARLMIVMAPDDALQDIPDDAICFTDESTVPTGFATYAPINDKFIIGANGGGNGGSNSGSDNHTHTSPFHNHSIAAHNHAGHALGAGTPFDSDNAPATTPALPRVHHSAAYDNESLGTSGLSSPSTDPAVSNDPAFVKLLGIQNTSGSPATPDDVVLAYVGAVSGIPSGWVLMDGTNGTIDCRDLQVKATTTVGEIGDTGGSNFHTHLMAGHTHQPSAFVQPHNHTMGTVSGLAASEDYTFDVTSTPTHTVDHTHSWTITSTNVGNSSTETPSADSQDIRVEYRTVVFIKRVPDQVNFFGAVA